MTLHPPLSIQGAGNVENAVDWRHFIYAMSQAFGGAGVIGTTALQVTVNNGTSATPSVNIAVGPAVVAGTAAHQGSYSVYSDATETRTHTTRDGSHARIDTVIAHVRDNSADPGDAGGNNDFVLSIVAGTPGASPAPPTLPDDCMALADVLVPTGTTAITITDRRVKLPAAFHVSSNLAVDGTATITGSLTSGAINLGAGTIDGLEVSGISLMHAGLDPSVEFGFLQHSAGDTALNCKAGQSINAYEGGTGTTPLWSARDTSGSTDFRFDNGLPTVVGGEVSLWYTPGTGQVMKGTSSRRYKHDELPLASTHDAERIVRNVAPKTFIRDGDETETRRAGFIAEDVAVHYPQGAVYSTADDGSVQTEGIDPDALLSVTWGALQSALAKIDRLEEQVSALRRA